MELTNDEVMILIGTKELAIAALNKLLDQKDKQIDELVKRVEKIEEKIKK
jgi:hypothetical protein